MSLESMPPALRQFVQQQVASGTYPNPEAVVAEAVRCRANEAHYLDWVRARIAEADESLRKGNVLDLDDKEWDELFDRIARGESVARQRVGQ